MPVYAPEAPGGRTGALHFAVPPDYGTEPLFAVHGRAYLEFLSSCQNGVDAGTVKVLRYLGDGCEEMEPDLWVAIQRSAHSAVAAALWVSRKGMQGSAAGALSYPNGRHASHSQARLKCYVNNQAIAANTLLQSVDRVVVFSLGVVHADGVQAMFYERADVMTISLHSQSASQDAIAVHTGMREEWGAGEGYGYNLNFPLGSPLCETAMLRTLENALGALQDYRVQAVVLSLQQQIWGGGAQLGRELGQRIRALELPTVVIIESQEPMVKARFEIDGFFSEFLPVMS